MQTQVFVTVKVATEFDGSKGKPSERGVEIAHQAVMGALDLAIKSRPSVFAEGLNGATLVKASREDPFEDGPASRTATETVALANELAREFYRLMGYVVPEGYRFDKAHHPHEVRCWHMAMSAFEMIEGTELSEMLSQAECDEEDGE